MEGSRMVTAACFALVMICFFWIQGAYVVTPMLQGGLYATEKTISTSIDTLSAAEEGTVKLDIPKAMIKSVTVSYETAGDKDGYKVSEDGWHVIVSYKIGTSTVKGTSLIRSYQQGASVQKTIVSPQALCVVKERENPYAEVQKC